MHLPSHNENIKIDFPLAWSTHPVIALRFPKVGPPLTLGTTAEGLFKSV